MASEKSLFQARNTQTEQRYAATGKDIRLKSWTKQRALWLMSNTFDLGSLCFYKKTWNLFCFLTMKQPKGQIKPYADCVVDSPKNWTNQILFAS